MLNGLTLPNSRRLQTSKFEPSTQFELKLNKYGTGNTGWVVKGKYEIIPDPKNKKDYLLKLNMVL